MFVPSVKRFAAGSALAVLALSLGVAAPGAGAEERMKHHDGHGCTDELSCQSGQNAIRPYVINPYQVYQTDVDGIHYFKGGSGWGFGYPYYGNRHINSSSAQIYNSQAPALSMLEYGRTGGGAARDGRCARLPDVWCERTYRNLWDNKYFIPFGY
jgi:hypothetical protein